MSLTSGASCKVCFDSQIHRVAKLPATFSSFKKLVRSFYESQLPENWVFQYTDSDGDRIVLSNNQDYEIFQVENFSSSSSMKVHIVPLSQIQGRGQETEQERAKKSIVTPESGKLKEKQRRFALKLIENLKRHDISKAKREKMENQLKELNIRVPSPKKEKETQDDDDSKTQDVDRSSINVESPSKKTNKNDQKEVVEKVSQPVHSQRGKQAKSSQALTRGGYALSKKAEEINHQSAIKRKGNKLFLDDAEIVESEDEEEVYEEKNDLKKATLQPQEKAMKLKEIFSDANLENLLAFTNEFPYLELDELVENYLRF